MSRVVCSVSIGLLALAIGCQQPGGKAGDSPESFVAAKLGRDISIRGAGATFPFPVYSKWAFRYYESTGMRLSYQQIGSAAGVAAAKDGSADFGASDVPLADAELEAAGLVQFPMVLGGIVVVANVPGIESGRLKLSGRTLAMIFHGKVKRWNAPEIRAENPKVELPDRDIVPIYRADPSGTTWIFTNFLSRVSEEWARTVGVGATASWPAGVGAHGNDQVARFVNQFKYTLAYVEYSHAVSQGLAWLRVDDGTGVAKEPGLEAFEQAAVNGKWEVGASVRFRPPRSSQNLDWPIVDASYVLVKRHQKSRKKAREVLDFFHWALTEGAEVARDLKYATVPAQHVEQIEKLWSAEIRADGEAVWWSEE